MRLYTESSNIEVLFSNRMSLWPQHTCSGLLRMLMKLLTTSPMYEYMGKNTLLHYRSFHIRNMLYFVSIVSRLSPCANKKKFHTASDGKLGTRLILCV